MILKIFFSLRQTSTEDAVELQGLPNDKGVIVLEVSEDYFLHCSGCVSIDSKNDPLITFCTLQAFHCGWRRFY